MLSGVLCLCGRMTRENSAGSEMSKLLSFGYLDSSPATAVDARKSSGGTRCQPLSAGPPTTPGHDFMMSRYNQAGTTTDQRSTAGSLPSSQSSPQLPPAASSAA